MVLRSQLESEVLIADCGHLCNTNLTVAGHAQLHLQYPDSGCCCIRLAAVSGATTRALPSVGTVYPASNFAIHSDMVRNNSCPAVVKQCKGSVARFKFRRAASAYAVPNKGSQRRLLSIVVLCRK